MEQDRKISFKGKSIYVGIDVHKKSWNICIICENIEHKKHTTNPNPSELGKYLRRNFPRGDYYSVYEAGFCGFWIHDALTKEGIKNIVVNPADVPTTDKEKKRKTDRVDSRKLARALSNGYLNGIYVPDREQQEDRSLVRLRTLKVKDQTRIKNRIKNSISNYGILIPEDQVGSYWSKKYIESIREVIPQLKTLNYTVEYLLQSLENERETVLDITREIRKLSESPKYEAKVNKLRNIPGISTLTAMTILTEFGDSKEYHRLDKMVSYVGLTPNESSSGETENKLSITKRGNSFLKHVIIEAAWIAVRKDTELMLAFLKYTKRMKKVKAIVKIARKLINRIRYVLVSEKEYQMLTN